MEGAAGAEDGPYEMVSDDLLLSLLSLTPLEEATRHGCPFLPLYFAPANSRESPSAMAIRQNPNIKGFLKDRIGKTK